VFEGFNPGTTIAWLCPWITMALPDRYKNKKQKNQKTRGQGGKQTWGKNDRGGEQKNRSFFFTLFNVSPTPSIITPTLLAASSGQRII